MKKTINIIGKISIFLAFSSIGGLIYNMFFYERLRPLILGFKDITAVLESMQIPVALIFIFLFLFHALTVIYVFLQIVYFKREDFLRALAFFLSIISMLMVLGDFALLNDIGKEHAAGLDTSGEWPMLYASQILHFVFLIVIIILIFMTFKKIRRDRQEVVLKDEAVFINAQYIGILSGLLGIAFFGFLLLTAELWAVKKGIFMVSLISILPYLLIVAYWLIIKVREKRGPWYDEKQYIDISRASLFTMVTSLVIMTVVYVVQYFIQSLRFLEIMWFPFFFFLVLLLFSASTLFFSKRPSG